MFRLSFWSSKFCFEKVLIGQYLENFDLSLKVEEGGEETLLIDCIFFSKSQKVISCS